MWGIALSESVTFNATDPNALSNAMFLRPIIIWAAAIALLTSFVLIIILTTVLLRSFLKSANNHPLSSGTRAALTVSAIVCAALAVGSTILYGVSYDKAQDEARQRCFDHKVYSLSPILTIRLILLVGKCCRQKVATKVATTLNMMTI